MNYSYTLKEKLFFLLIAIYSFTVCFGNFFRFGARESAIGLSTIIFFLVLVTMPFRSIKGVLSSPILKYFFLLLLVSLFSAAFYPGKVLLPMMGTAQLFGYLLIAGVTANMHVEQKMMRKVFFGITLGLLVSSLITIVDYLRIYDFPFVNENKIFSKYGGIDAEQAGGFFSRRSAMAAYLSLFIPMITVVGLDLYRGLAKFLVFVAAGTSFVSLFLTHNRSGILGILIALTMFIILNKNYELKKKLKFGLLMTLLVLSIGTILYLYFPEHITIYMEKLGLGDGRGTSLIKGKSLAESDASRIYFFLESLKSMLSSPIGHGFATMYTQQYGFLDTHNIISYIIWATGVFGIAWIIYLFISFRVIFKNNILNSEMFSYTNAIKYGFISWFVNNMAHNNMHMGMVWILLGFLISLNRNNIANYNTRSNEKIELLAVSNNKLGNR